MLELEMETATSLRDEIEEIKHNQRMKQERDQAKMHSVQK